MLLIITQIFNSGCQTSGVYGNDCKQKCPINCKDNVCHIQMGTCFRCASGWMDLTCYTSMITLTFTLSELIDVNIF